MAISTITRIDLASDVKIFISKVDVGYSDDSFRDKILSTNNNAFLKITKSIGSDTIITGVVDVDDAYVTRAIVGE